MHLHPRKTQVECDRAAQMRRERFQQSLVVALEPTLLPRPREAEPGSRRAFLGRIDDDRGIDAPRPPELVVERGPIEFVPRHQVFELINGARRQEQATFAHEIAVEPGS